MPGAYGADADAKDLDVMEAMVAEEAPPEPEAAPDISDDAKEQIQQIFKLYDKNKDGSLNANELVNALVRGVLHHCRLHLPCNPGPCMHSYAFASQPPC